MIFISTSHVTSSRPSSTRSCLEARWSNKISYSSTYSTLSKNCSNLSMIWKTVVQES